MTSVSIYRLDQLIHAMARSQLRSTSENNVQGHGRATMLRYIIEQFTRALSIFKVSEATKCDCNSCAGGTRDCGTIISDSAVSSSCAGTAVLVAVGGRTDSDLWTTSSTELPTGPRMNPRRSCASIWEQGTPSTDSTTSPMRSPAASAADPDSVAVTLLPVPFTTSPMRIPTPAVPVPVPVSIYTRIGSNR